jgi:EmrB/QacA subfamily drug resistance transporter
VIRVLADNHATPPALILPRFLSPIPLSQIPPSAEQPSPITDDSAQQGRPLVAIIVAIAFLMEQLDATIVTTAIPDMARSLQVSAVQMSLAVSAYVLTLAVFIPLSGWCADRFGGRRVFVAALGLFTTGSVLCGLADSFPMLVAMRVLQGLGGAMMTPVGRLILLRNFPRSQLVRAMTYATLPAIIGPVIGPLLGGYLTTALSWRWIFYVNLPFGLLGMVLTARFIRDLDTPAPPAFDLWGFMLFGLAVGLVQVSLEGADRLPVAWLAVLLLGAVALLGLFWHHSRTRSHPAVDLGLLRERAFGIATLAGGLCRIAMNGPVYLLPLMLQLGLGMSPVQSGALTFLSAVASPVVRVFVGTALRRLGFRTLLLISALACTTSLCTFALIGPHTETAWIAAAIVFYGLVRSTQFMTSNTLAYADIDAQRLSRATSLGGLLQQLTVSFGVSLGAAWLGLFTPHHLMPSLATFHLSFLLLAALPLLALPVFIRLQPHDGAIVSGHVAPQNGG